MNFTTSSSSSKGESKRSSQPKPQHSEATLDKLKMIQERRNQFMNNKMIDETYQKEKKQFLADQPQPTATLNRPKFSGSPTRTSSNTLASPPKTINAHTDQLLQQLTYKLTHHIQENIRKEQQNSQLQEKEVCNTIISRIDDFVSNELSSFLCPICYEIMAPPDHLPILLFPCGHTFCQLCLEQHFSRKISESSSTRSNALKTCPYCR
jgi:hypothetical protein